MGHEDVSFSKSGDEKTSTPKEKKNSVAEAGGGGKRNEGKVTPPDMPKNLIALTKKKERSGKASAAKRDRENASSDRADI